MLHIPSFNICHCLTKICRLDKHIDAIYGNLEQKSEGTAFIRRNHPISIFAYDKHDKLSSRFWKRFDEK